MELSSGGAVVRIGGINNRAPRIDIRKAATVISSDGVESKATVLDVSSGGFRAEFEESPQVGEFVTLCVDREKVPAQMRWSLGWEGGGMFLARIDHDFM